MSYLEQMTYGAGGTMEFNAGYERAQEEMRQQLDKLNTELKSAHESLAITQTRLVQLQSNAAVRMVNSINPMIDALAELLAPQLERVVESKMQEKIDALGVIDDERIKNLIQGELEEVLDGKIKEEVEEAVEEAVENYCNNEFDLSDKVREEVRRLDFEVSVS